MNPLSILLATCSLAIIALGAMLFRITTSRSIMLNCFFGSACLLFAAYHAVTHTKPEWTFMLPFLSSMLFVGRTLGTWWRVRKEAELLPLARLLSAASIICLVATSAAWFWR